MREVRRLDFSGQDIFIGLDVHKKSWEVTIRTRDFEHKTFTQNPDPEVLVNYVHRHFPGARYHSVYEAGFCGFWIHDELEAHGVNNMVIHPPDVPTKDKERRRKSNKVDCRKLARGLCNGELEPIYIPSVTARADRSLVRARRAAVKQQGRYKNQIKGMLHFYGLEIPERSKKGKWSGYFIRWLEGLEIENESGTEALRYYIDELKHHRRRLCDLNKRVKALSRTDRYRERVRNLMTIPGIGMITAMILLTELIDIGRFKHLDHVASYIGLVPGERSSGEDTYHTGIIRRGHVYLRSILIECAWVAVRKDPALMMAYYELTCRMSGQKAIIRIARKLLNRIFYVLRNNEPYVMAVVE